MIKKYQLKGLATPRVKEKLISHEAMQLTRDQFTRGVASPFKCWLAIRVLMEEHYWLKHWLYKASSELENDC